MYQTAIHAGVLTITNLQRNNMQSVAQQFDEWLGGINYDKDDRCAETYPFWLRVGVVKSCPPRHERFDYMREMGMGQIEDVMQGNPLNSEHLTFVFPERHMTVQEKQSFMFKLAKHPDAVSGKIMTMDMLTSCAFMISSFHKEQINILEWESDEHYLAACR